MVKFSALPVHPAADGVTFTVATIGAKVVLLAAKEPMSPIPDAASPIDVVVLVQSYCVPGTEPLKFTVGVNAVLHTTMFAGSTTVGVGFTLMVKCCVVPVQP